ncbi:Ubiquitin system component CUE protein [Quillaja saponaria]|uniref:Ubiquitin system component CUE protein n=1 Tax=Quillaja saponaria TaxID=32244 RepID=A0AAD7PDT5_QUISA|nr:Ubiquitin system component CUE protein [Quillaja saponaria]
MSAAVSGSKRSFFEDLHPSPPVFERLRCSSSTSPIRFSAPTLVDQLRAMFPHMEPQLLDRALQECGNDIDAAIKSLHELCLGSASENSLPAEGSDTNVEQGTLKIDGNTFAFEDPSALDNLPLDGTEWVDLFVREMMSVISVDDTRARVARMLEILEKSISARASVETTQIFQKVNN